MFIIIDSLLIPFLIRQSSVCTYVSPKEITRAHKGQDGAVPSDHHDWEQGVISM